MKLFEKLQALMEGYKRVNQYQQYNLGPLGPEI